MFTELKVKPGDVVAIEDGYNHPSYEITTVERVTPTGQIVVSDYSRRFDKEGWEIGGNSLHRRQLRALTPKIQAEAMRRKIKAVNWDKVTDTEIMHIAEYFGFITKKNSF